MSSGAPKRYFTINRFTLMLKFGKVSKFIVKIFKNNKNTRLSIEDARGEYIIDGRRVRVVASPRRHCPGGRAVVVKSPWWHASAGGGITTQALPRRWSGGGQVTVVVCECGWWHHHAGTAPAVERWCSSHRLQK